MSKPVTRRTLLQAAGVGSLAAGVTGLAGSARAETTAQMDAPGRMSHGHAMGVVGSVDTELFHPGRLLETWNFSDLGGADRDAYYRETPQGDGTLLRE